MTNLMIKTQEECPMKTLAASLVNNSVHKQTHKWQNGQKINRDTLWGLWLPHWPKHYSSNDPIGDKIHDFFQEGCPLRDVSTYMADKNKLGFYKINAQNTISNFITYSLIEMLGKVFVEKIKAIIGKMPSKGCYTYMVKNNT